MMEMRVMSYNSGNKSKWTRNVIIVAAGLVSVIAMSCGNAHDGMNSNLNLDSFHSRAFDGFIDDGFIVTAAASDEIVREQIEEQLRYSVGLLNTWSGVGDLSRTLAKSIKIKDRTVVSEGRWRVSYTASMTVVWSNSYQRPGSVMLILPSGTDSNLGMPKKFVDRYNVPACLDPSNHGVGIGSIWYYLRPYQRGCELGNSRNVAPLSVRFPMRLEESAINTTGHSPEYKKFWEDGKLVVTSVFSRNSPGRDPNDEGYSQYRYFYQRMVSTFGQPIEVSAAISPNGPDLDTTAYAATFNTVKGPIVVHTWLVDGMTNNGDEFDSQFATVTADSDVVNYNGHAGLGSNVRGLARRFSVNPGQYQLFVINGCDTFAYVDDLIMQKHKDKNPGYPDYKFVDVIANTMPSYFSYNTHTAVNVISAAVQSNATYRQILSNFDRSQHAVVFGEEDNGQ
jgi:hypothetical protein